MNQNFNSYLTGLFEGDGHISIPKKGNPRFCITTHEKNEPWLLSIKTNLSNYGWVRRKRKERALVLTISNMLGLKLVVNKLNGHFKTPKIEKFQELINWINIKENTCIQLLPINYNFDNSWLTGFIEADGCFMIRFTEYKLISKKKPRCATRFSLDQRMFGPTSLSYKPIMENIANFLKCNLLIINKKKVQKQYFNITISGQEKIKGLISYLDQYPLSSSKYLDYLDWKQAYELLQQKEHLIFPNKIKLLKCKMNNSRLHFIWNHLEEKP